MSFENEMSLKDYYLSGFVLPFCPNFTWQGACYHVNSIKGSRAEHPYEYLGSDLFFGNLTISNGEDIVMTIDRDQKKSKKKED